MAGASLVTTYPAWTRPTPDVADCPVCGKDSCDGDACGTAKPATPKTVNRRSLVPTPAPPA